MSLRRRRRWRSAVLAVLLVLSGGAGVALVKPDLLLELEFARLRLLAGAGEHQVAVDEHVWRYVETGEGPPLVLIHGFTGSKENWLPVMRALGHHYRVIAPDLPGWGESTRLPDAVYGFPEQAARLERFIATLLPNQSVTVVGHSMGGGIAALWAGNQPAALQRLVLLDAAGVPFDNDFAQRIRAGEHPFEVTDEATLARQLDLVFKHKPFVPWPASKAFAARRARDVGFERAVLRAVAGDEALAFAPGEAARQIRVPTLLLWCRDDRIIDAQAAEEYAQRIADQRKVWIDDCNHMPMMEQPAETARRLLEFLGDSGTGSSP